MVALVSPSNGEIEIFHAIVMQTEAHKFCDMAIYGIRDGAHRMHGMTK